MQVGGGIHFSNLLLSTVVESSVCNMARLEDSSAMSSAAVLAILNQCERVQENDLDTNIKFYGWGENASNRRSHEHGHLAFCL